MSISIQYLPDQPTATQFRDTVNAQLKELDSQRTVIDGLERRAKDTNAELVKIDRMLADTTALQEKVRASEKAVVTDIGDKSDLLRQAFNQYVREDGSVRLFDEKVTREFFGMKLEHTERGYLTDPNPVNTAQYRMQRSYAALIVMRNIGATLGADLAAGSQQRLMESAVREVITNLRQVDGAIGKALTAQFERSFGAASGSGSDWVVAAPNGQVLRPAELNRDLLRLLPQQNAVKNTWTRFTQAGNTLPMADAGVSNDPTTRSTPRNFTTGSGNVTCTDVSILANVYLTWLRDVAPDLPNAGQVILDWLASNMAAGLEIGIIHGDNDGTHMDAAGLAAWTYNNWITAGLASDSRTIVHKVNGLRRRSIAGSTSNSVGTWAASVPLAALNRMGLRAASQGIFWLTGLACLYQYISASSAYLTYDKVGPLMTGIQGALGTLAGKPIYTSQFMANDLNSSGVRGASSNTEGYILGVDPTGLVVYIHDSGSLSVDKPDKNVRVVGTTLSFAFESICDSNEIPVTYDYHINA